MGAGLLHLLHLVQRAGDWAGRSRQVRCNLQVTLCDPYLSALSVRYYKKCAI